jgi:hypothetical protein
VGMGVERATKYLFVNTSVPGYLLDGIAPSTPLT